MVRGWLNADADADAVAVAVAVAVGAIVVGEAVNDRDTNSDVGDAE